MIIKAIKRPVEVEALRFDGQSYKALTDFGGKYVILKGSETIIMTHKGRVKVNVGDYVVKEPGRKAGEYYVMAAEEFENIFDIVIKKKSMPKNDQDKSELITPKKQQTSEENNSSE